MAIKQYTPYTPSRRGMSGYSFEEITKSKPERAKQLIELAQKEATNRWHLYEEWAAIEYGNGAKG